jgi:hypothetical protein
MGFVPENQVRTQLWGEQGRRAEARDLLAPVYGWFTEGFESRSENDSSVP